MIESVVTINESDISSLEKVLKEILIEGKDKLQSKGNNLPLYY